MAECQSDAPQPKQASGEVMREHPLVNSHRRGEL
jgi:hypothetical protein